MAIISEQDHKKKKRKKPPYIAPSELKTILHSKRANIFYLEYCRVLVNGGRVEYVTDEGRKSLYWNIPIANTTTLLLGNGTSITQAAVRELAKAGVMVGFSGGGGTPLFAGTERTDISETIDLAWLSPQSEYRPTNYLQAWVSFWFKEEGRLAAAKSFQSMRLDRVEKSWLSREMAIAGFFLDEPAFQTALKIARAEIDQSETTEALLMAEARLTKSLFKLAAQATKYGEFTRKKKGTGKDDANRFLDHGNYLAYGLGATAAWVLGLPFGFAILHGKTRRGGLVFDIADLIKDSVILPLAFISAKDGDEEQQFRGRCIKKLIETEALDFMIDQTKKTAEETAFAYGLGASE
ncbi:type I-F CRISPR-associated endonuclease Cas1 [Acetobacteraceae bacterium]|nr:type I-F CRISPR-associated endonuclease Cas1 [Acetobacteraceae bacterium]